MSRLDVGLRLQQAEQTCRTDMHDRHACLSCRTDMQGRHAGQTCRADMQLTGRRAMSSWDMSLVVKMDWMKRMESETDL